MCSPQALLECEGDSIDLSGDVGAVGRVVISDDSFGNHEMLLDLKGLLSTLYFLCLLYNLEVILVHNA